jgi:hypothetical protein
MIPVAILMVLRAVLPQTARRGGAVKRPTRVGGPPETKRGGPLTLSTLRTPFEMKH